MPTVTVHHAGGSESLTAGSAEVSRVEDAASRAMRSGGVFTLAGVEIPGADILCVAVLEDEA